VTDQPTPWRDTGDNSRPSRRRGRLQGLQQGVQVLPGVGLAQGLQALIGGITVLTGLNPFVVGIHYVISTLLVCLCTIFLFLLRGGATPAGPRRTPRLLRPAALCAAVLASVTIVLGVLTTGAGPHSGDVDAGRNGFDATVLQHLHATPSYLLLALTVLIVVVTLRAAHPARSAAVALLAVEAAQIAVGVFQAQNGLPPLAVGVHMVLASLLAAALTWLLCAVHSGESRERR